MSPAAAGSGRGAGRRQTVPEDLYAETGMKTGWRRYRKQIALGFAAFLMALIWLGLQPLRGTIHVGVCRTILELEIRYPSTLRVNSLEWFDKGLRLYFTHIDAFGQNRSETFECVFNADSSDLKLEDLKRNRKSLSPETVKRYNVIMPVIIESNPDTVLPDSFSENLQDLKVD